MTAVLAALTRAMRALMLGPNPPQTVEDLRSVCLAGASAPHRGVVDATHGMRHLFNQLSDAVFAGKSYSDIAGPPGLGKINPEVRALWDAACLCELAPAT